MELEWNAKLVIVPESAIPAAICSLVNAARLCSNMILHQVKIAPFRRIEDVGLVCDASSSSSLQTQVRWDDGIGFLG